MRALDFAYAVAALLTAEAAGLKIPWLTWTAKPLLMPLLAFEVWRYQRRNNGANEIYRPLLAALAWAWIGDMLLMNEALFLPGVAAFLVMQALYSYAMLFRLKPALTFGPALVVLVSVAGVSLAQYALMGSRLGAYRYPMIIYLCFLSLMLASAAFQAGRKPEHGTLCLIMGAILFFISDNLIALDRFLQPIPASGFWIMTTYAAAQWLLVRGFIVTARD